MKKIFFYTLLFLVPLFSVAQSANQLLDQVSEKVQSYDNIVIDFKYALVNKKENLSQETRGEASLQGNKYVLNLMGTTQIFDGSKLHVIIPEDEEINISEADPNSLTPSKMFTFYKKGYKAVMDIEQNVNGRKIQYVKLTPTTPSSEIKFIMLGIDKESKHIYRQILSQHNGTEITITINQFKTNQPLSSTLFTFEESKYPDYYINRLD